MEPFDRRARSEDLLPEGRQTSIQLSEPARPTGTTGVIRTPKIYQVCDQLSGGLILLLVVATPWAFGTTRDWAVGSATLVALALGALLLMKWALRQKTGFHPPRWGEPVDSLTGLPLTTKRSRDGLTIALAVLTVLVLAYTLVSAINARAVYQRWQSRFDYRNCIEWLPHSYDGASTWAAFWRYTGLACFFWATRDWLLGKGTSGRKKRRRSRDLVRTRSTSESAPKIVLPPEAGGASGREGSASIALPQVQAELPKRLRLLLWVLCINGSLLALEAILQRLSGTNKLLWVLLPLFNQSADVQFGPYAYRANAASYFNLLWPVSLGFWLVLRQAAQRRARVGARIGTGSYLVLLPGAVLMAACPIISTARGGAIVAVVNICVTLVILLLSTRNESLWFRVGAGSLFAVVLAVSASLGLKQLVPRFQTIFTDRMSQRTEIYQNALPMAHDFPILGSGPGTFGTLYQLYRTDLNQDWAAYAHDDWLETRITYGWVGFVLILAMLGVAVSRWWVGNGIKVPWELTATLWTALAGCLLHAKFDFPLQIHSILLLFLLLCAILFCVSRPEKTT